jgi:ribonuclease R
LSSRRTPKPDPALPTRQQILEFLRDHPGKAGKREIARAFNVRSGDRIALKRLLRDMADEGMLERRRKRLARPGLLAPVEVLEITGRDDDGELIASPTDWDEDAHGTPPVVAILPDRGRRARAPSPGVGDRALVRISATDQPGEGPALEGRIIRVLESRPRRVVGVFERRADGSAVVHSADKKDRRDYMIAPADENDARDGELVEIEVARGTRLGLPRGKVAGRIGDMKSEKAVSLIALVSHGIPHVFPDSVLDEARAAKPAKLGSRTDLRDLPLVTIDPADAKDHDDAVHAAPDADPDNPGGFVVTVAIADVAAYVPEGGALDRSARIRGNSVYFPDRVVPMLPEELSADLCSLRADEDRPAMVCEMVIGSDGRKRRHRFLRAMIRVAANIDYNQAQAAAEGRPDDEATPVADSVIRPLWDAFRATGKERAAREPLDLDLPERKLVLDGTGHVARVYVPPRLDSHQLIEAFMIMANVAAAETLEKRRTPLLYRVHDSPSPEKLAALADFLRTIGMKMPKAGVTLPRHFNAILAGVRDRENEQLVNEVILRTQAQAEYSPENFGHFGLNLRRYAHFTSPIRRYSDLVVHRALIRALDLGRDGLGDGMIAELEEIAAHISATERRAMAAERETVDRLIAHFLADRIGATFTGRIAGVTHSGVFVKLEETGADGFVPAATLGKDYYRFDASGRQMIGERTGETWRLGDTVEVRLVEAVPLAGALRFEIVSEGRYVSPKARSQPRGTAAPRRKGGKGGRRRN